MMENCLRCCEVETQPVEQLLIVTSRDTLVVLPVVTDSAVQTVPVLLLPSDIGYTSCTDQSWQLTSSPGILTTDHWSLSLRESKHCQETELGYKMMDLL